MIDHIGINAADMDAATAFYDTVLGVLGHRRLMDFGVAVGYGTTKPDFWISTFDGHRAEPRGPPRLQRRVGRGGATPSTTRPRRRGAETLHAPRLWPEYHERYYGAFVRDPDGNNVEAVCHTAPGD